MSKATCVNYAHKICDSVIGNCAKTKDSAVGGPVNYLIIYQCHKLDYGIVALVIAGSITEGGNNNKLNQLVRQSLNKASPLFNP